ncbi:hypothetical protein ACW6QP_03615 [Salegentibacter sp. HM20]
MNKFTRKTKKWGKRALAFKVGKYALRKGGIVGVGVGAAAGAAYLAYKFAKDCRKKNKPLNEITTDKNEQIVV